MSETRDGAMVIRRHDTAATPFHRVIDHPTSTEDLIEDLAIAHGGINPAAVHRRIQALTRELLTLTTSKASARVNRRA